MKKGIQKILYLILASFIGLFIASSFFIRAKYNYFVYGDTPVLEKQQLGLFILGIVVMLVLSIILYRICLKLNQYRLENRRSSYIAVFFCYSDCDHFPVSSLTDG
jgi:hypothetical protein